MPDYRAIQAKLNALGTSPPLDVDGVWGTKSQNALRAFQKARGLAVDGVPGTNTLRALGLSGASAAPGSAGGQEAMSYQGDKKVAAGSPSDVKAYQVALRAAPTMPEAQRQYVLAVARGEGFFGQGWGNPSAATIAKSQAFGLTGKEGAGSNNWGATQGQGDAGSFPHVDSGWMVPDADGKPTSRHWQGSGPKVWGNYVAQYKRWTTPEKGFLDIANVILGGGTRKAAGAEAIKAAISKGDLQQAVNEQHANGYFELNPADYFAAVSRNYEALSASTGWKRALGVAAGVGAGLLFVGTLAAVGVAWWLARKA